MYGIILVAGVVSALWWLISENNKSRNNKTQNEQNIGNENNNNGDCDSVNTEYVESTCSTCLYERYQLNNLPTSEYDDKELYLNSKFHKNGLLDASTGSSSVSYSTGENRKPFKAWTRSLSQNRINVLNNTPTPPITFMLPPTCVTKYPICEKKELERILDDLTLRFITTVPVEERENIVEFCRHIEIAHWSYLDDYCKKNENLDRLNFNQFADELFRHVPFLSMNLKNIKQILAKFQLYKDNIPTYGAILLSKDFTNVLMIQSYCSKDLWGFPKGKIEKNEDPLRCAIRETLEETNYDISNRINPDWYIEGEWSSCNKTCFTGLYIIPDVPMDTAFAARNEGEIKSHNWFRLKDLLNDRRFNRKRKIQVTKHAFCVKNLLKRFLIEKQLLNRDEPWR